MALRARGIFVFAVGIAIGLGAFACDDSRDLAPDADVCTRATHLFATCGVVLPTLSNAPCTGVARVVARCVTDHSGGDCDGLARLAQRLDACVVDSFDGGEILPPAADLPVPLGDPRAPADAGKDAENDGDAEPLSLRDHLFPSTVTT